MITRYKTAPRFIRDLSTPAKFLIALAVLALVFVGLLKFETDYNRDEYIATTVIAKTQSTETPKSGSTLKFLLALRYPDGATQDVYTSFATYSQTPVGSKWGVTASKLSRGLPMPLLDTLRFLGLLISGLGMVLLVICAFGYSLVFGNPCRSY